MFHSVIDEKHRLREVKWLIHIHLVIHGKASRFCLNVFTAGFYLQSLPFVAKHSISETS